MQGLSFGEKIKISERIAGTSFKDAMKSYFWQHNTLFYAMILRLNDLLI